jgi:hypothetical protein
MFVFPVIVGRALTTTVLATDVTAPTESVALMVNEYVPGLIVESTRKTARLFACVIVKPLIEGVPERVKVLLPVPVPEVAVNVSHATIPEVVVMVPVVLSTRIGGLIVIVYA